jgi:hypothetical protein
VGALRFEMPRLSPQQAQSEVPASQVPALLAAVQKEDVIRLSTDSAQWQVSLHGAAALLKMDDLQGRVGTPGALVRQGTKPESSVPAPAVPGVKAARHVHQEALRPQCVEHRRSDDALGMVGGDAQDQTSLSRARCGRSSLYRRATPCIRFRSVWPPVITLRITDP